ncbi:hypothetical protein LPJ61_004925, partial [Coemansia biformis]
DKAADVERALAQEYYGKRFPGLSAAQLGGALFATTAGRGACYFGTPVNTEGFSV